MCTTYEACNLLAYFPFCDLFVTSLAVTSVFYLSTSAYLGLLHIKKLSDFLLTSVFFPVIYTCLYYNDS